MQDFSNIFFCHPDRNALEWRDLAFGVQSMVWQDPSATLRMTGINNIASFCFHSETIFNHYKKQVHFQNHYSLFLSS